MKVTMNDLAKRTWFSVLLQAPGPGLHLMRAVERQHTYFPLNRLLPESDC